MLNRQTAAIAWYRLTTTWRSRRTGYLTVIVLVALVGGLALGAVAAARRTQSSYPTLVASTDPSDLNLATAIDNPAIGNGLGYNPAIVAELKRVPHVKAVGDQPGVNMAPLKPDGAPAFNSSFPAQAGTALGSLGGEFFTIDRLAVTEGTLPDQARANQFITTPVVAAAYGFHVGQVIPMGFYTNADTDSSEFGTAAVKPYRVIDMTLTGVGEPATSVVRDDVDEVGFLAVLTPALTKTLLDCCVNYDISTLVVDRPSDVASVERAIEARAPAGAPATFGVPAVATVAKAERAIKPESIALGVFGGIAGLAALLIVGQIMGRQLRLRAYELGVLRALGAGPAVTAADGLFGLLVALLLGSVLAVVVAIALSPIAPLGPVRPVYPSPGIAFDWTVLGLGFAALVVALVAIASALAYRNAPERATRRERAAGERPSRVVSATSTLGLPTPAATGVQFALESGTGGRTVPVRSAILGAALAAIVLVTTVTFGGSLDHLVSTPALYGWNWNYALAAGDGGGGGDVPAAQATPLLEHDRYLSAWSGTYFSTLIIDGQQVPSMGFRPGAAVQPPILSGHDVQGSGQIVLGEVTLAALHKRLGDEVSVNSGVGPTEKLKIVGTATLPTFGSTGALHLEMGSGAVVPSSIFSALDKNPFGDPETGPNDYLVDVRRGVNQAAAHRSLEAMTGPLSNSYNFGVIVQSVLHPAEIVNYRSVGTTPAILGAALGAGAVIALGLTLLASVRRRRRDLALLKTLGFTRRQLATTVSWQSNVAVITGVVVGTPLGIIVGRVLWDVFAHEINAVPAPVIPVLPVILIVIGAIVLANVVSVLPGRIAATTPTALLLRAE